MNGTEVLIDQLGPLSYIGIWGVSVLSNVLIPVPEEAVLLVLGYLAGGPRFDIFILFPVVLSGLLLSDIVMYFFSLRGNKLVSAFYDRVFASRLESRKEWIDKHMNKVIFFSRFLVQLRFLGPFFAGQSGMSLRKFLTLDFLALAIYTPLYLFIGFYFRSRIEFITSGIGAVRNIIILVFLSVFLFSLLRFIKKFLLKTRPNIENLNEKNDSN